MRRAGLVSLVGYHRIVVALILVGSSVGCAMDSKPYAFACKFAVCMLLT
jgi:hypothetical protein